jgi:hypothetical protein
MPHSENADKPSVTTCGESPHSDKVPIDQYKLLIEQFKRETEAARRSTLATLQQQDKVIALCSDLLLKIK